MVAMAVLAAVTGLDQRAAFSGFAPQLFMLYWSCGGSGGVRGSNWLGPENRILGGFVPQLFTLYWSCGGGGGVGGSDWIGPASCILTEVAPQQEDCHTDKWLLVI